ncbi:variable large family protein [Borrelia turicatae]|uniref:variable large family protein n=1 Tax=Borrelia turicatae TaxID=142 RepID=UPI002ED1F872
MRHVIMKRITLSALLMTLFLLLGCGSGSAKTEDPKTLFLTSIANLGKGFLDVFVTFSDMVTGALGINAETKKEDIGKYFTDIANTMNTVKKKLNTVVAENGNYPKIKEVVVQFITNTLDKIAEGAKTAASGANDGAVIGGVVKSNAAENGPDAESVKNLVVGIKEIVDLVLKDGDGQADKTTPLEDDKKNIGKLFGAKNSDANGGAEDKHVAAASASIGAVTGADILKAIAVANADAKKDGKVSEATDAATLALAKGTSDDNDDQLGDSAKKDAIIAAGIVLRAMAKDGKFIVKDIAEKKTEADAAKGVAASAVGKTLSTLIIAIRNTVDTGLKTISEALAAVKQEDKAVDSTTPADATASGQQQ